jgi:hypothetical protein
MGHQHLLMAAKHTAEVHTAVETPITMAALRVQATQMKKIPLLAR